MGKGEPKLDTPLVQRNIILFLLFALAAAAWAVLAWTPTHMGMHMPTAPSTTTGHHALLFFTTWVVMMVAMMFRLPLACFSLSIKWRPVNTCLTMHSLSPGF